MGKPDELVRVEAIATNREIFQATGILEEVFTFAGPTAYYPFGILDVSIQNADGTWTELPLTKYAILVGGTGVKWRPGIRYPAGTKVKVVYQSPEGGGTMSSLSIIRDATDPSKRANVDNVFDDTADPMGLFTIPLFFDGDEGSEPGKPLQYESYDPTIFYYQILKPYLKGYSSNRGLSVGIHASRHEVLVGQRVPVTVVAGTQLVFNYIPTYKSRRVLGWLTHSFENQEVGMPSPTITIEHFDVFFTNGTIIYQRLSIRSFVLDSFNQEVWLDEDNHADFMNVVIDNPTASNGSVRVASLVGEVN